MPGQFRAQRPKSPLNRAAPETFPAPSGHRFAAERGKVPAPRLFAQGIVNNRSPRVVCADGVGGIGLASTLCPLRQSPFARINRALLGRSYVFGSGTAAPAPTDATAPPPPLLPGRPYAVS